MNRNIVILTPNINFVNETNANYNCITYALAICRGERERGREGREGREGRGGGEGERER